MVIFSALLFSAVGLTTAVLVVVNKVAMNGALFLVVTLFAVVASYILLGAEFLAAVQIIVYAGAIMVLIMFVIQLVGFQSTKEGLIQKQAPLAIIVVTLLFVQIAFFTTRSLSDLSIAPKTAEAVENHTAAFSGVLFTKYLLPFEIASVMLLVAIVGTILLAQHKDIRE